MNKKETNQIKSIFKAGLIMFLGLILFKFIPMQIWGEYILFDASLHITMACFILYIIWFFVDQNKKWRTVFFIFCFLVLTIISFQRIQVNAHNDIGLLGGLILSIIAIGYSQYYKIRGKIDF
jgi:hypothetical protein